MRLILLKSTYAVADPEFPRRGGLSQWRGKAIILAILSQKLHGIEKKIGPEGAHIPSTTSGST